VRDDEPEPFGYATGLALEVLEEKRKLNHIDNVWYHASSEQPSPEVRLRGYGDESTVIMDIDTGKTIDRLDKFRALRVFYPGAIYFHSGDTYALVHHDFDQNVVTVRRVNVSYYTDPLTGTAVDHVDQILDKRPLERGTAFLGEVFAILNTPVYEKVQFYTVERISQHPTDVPPVAYEAMSFWIDADPLVPQEVACLGLEPSEGMRGIMYCVSRILPLFLTSDMNDFDWTLGCKNSSWHTMFWFEFYMHGIGNAEQCYERLEEILAVTLQHLLTCDCEDGCPNCTSRLITPYHVRNIELGEGQVHSRRAAAVVLDMILNGHSAEEAVQVLEEPREKRGQQFLPTVTGEGRISEPHRMPLDDRTRRLMLRKIERGRSPRPAVDHRIEVTPPEGIPDAEATETVPETDVERRTKHTAIRRGGNALSRKLRERLRTAGRDSGSTQDNTGETGQPEPTATASSAEKRIFREQLRRRDVGPSTKRPAKCDPDRQPVPADTTAPESADTAETESEPAADQSAVSAGDGLARKARQLRKKRRKQSGNDQAS